MDRSTFVATWRGSTLKERSAAQEHFIDLCRLFGAATPTRADRDGSTADRDGSTYAIEKGAA